MKADNFLIAGNDMKMLECKNYLIDCGFDACLYYDDKFSQNLNKFNNIVLALPTVVKGCISGTNETVESLAENLMPFHKVFYGNLKSDPFGNQGFCYYSDETFLTENSRLTAQGVLRLILENTDRDISGLNIAVIGYGRCGKAISSMLNGIGAKVTVFSRRTESLIFSVNGQIICENTADIDKLVHRFDVIINTVPYNIIKDNGLRNLTNDNLYIEVASKPYGFDASLIDNYSFRYILASGLPGRFTPKAAGRNIAKTIIGLLKEAKNE